MTRTGKTSQRMDAVHMALAGLALALLLGILAVLTVIAVHQTQPGRECQPANTMVCYR